MRWGGQATFVALFMDVDRHFMWWPEELVLVSGTGCILKVVSVACLEPNPTAAATKVARLL